MRKNTDIKWHILIDIDNKVHIFTETLIDIDDKLRLLAYIDQW